MAQSPTKKRHYSDTYQPNADPEAITGRLNGILSVGPPSCSIGRNMDDDARAEACPVFGLTDAGLTAYINATHPERHGDHLGLATWHTADVCDHHDDPALFEDATHRIECEIEPADRKGHYRYIPVAIERL